MGSRVVVRVTIIEEVMLFWIGLVNVTLCLHDCNMSWDWVWIIGGRVEIYCVIEKGYGRLRLGCWLFLDWWSWREGHWWCDLGRYW